MRRIQNSLMLGLLSISTVSPVFARRNDQSRLDKSSNGNLLNDKDTGLIHGRCRHRGWTDDAELILKQNRNAIKARFCCADQEPAHPDYVPALNIVYPPGTDILIEYTDGNQISRARAAAD